MNVIKNFTRRNLTRNRKRTIVTIVGVILSTALVCTVVGMVATLQRSIVADYKKNQGDWHMEFGVERQDQYEVLVNNAHVEKSGVSQCLEFSKLGEKNEDGQYLTFYGLNDMAFSQLNVRTLEGRLPEKESEIVITKSYSEKDGAPKVGDSVSYTVGDRYYTSSDGSRMPYNGWEFSQTEEFGITGEKKYTVVGIVADNYSITGYGQRVYACFLRVNDYKGKYTKVYCRFDKPSRFDEISEGLTRTLDEMGGMYDCSTSMLVRFEGGFSERSMKMVLGLGLIISLIIVGTSIFVISNAFRISVEDKKMQLGMLVSVGATKRQIRGIVLREAAYIFAIGTTLGILLGAVAIWILDQIVNLLVGDLMSMEMIFTFPLWVVALTILLSAVTIFLAAFRPARAATRINPIEIIRGGSDIVADEKHLKCRKITRKLFGIGGVIAEKNLKRSRKKYRTTVVSLVIAVAVFIAISGFVGYGKRLVGEAYTKYDTNLLVMYNGERVGEGLKTGRGYYQKVRALPGIRDSVYAFEARMQLDAKKYCADEYRDAASGIEDGEINFSYYIIPEKDFSAYLKRLGLDNVDPSGVAILADRDIYYDLEEVKRYRRATNIEPGDKVTFSYVDHYIELSEEEEEAGMPDQEWKETSVTVAKLVDEDGLPVGIASAFHSYGGVLFLVSESHFEKLPADAYLGQLYIDAKDADVTEKDIDALNRPDDENGMTVNNFEQIKQTNDRMILVVEIFLYGFIIVISLIGVTNVLNTINTNMNLRRREFAMLQSIGMTRKEFGWMIRSEGILYSVRALMIGIPLGLILSYMVHLVIKRRYDYGFQIPWMSILISAVAVVLMVTIVMWSSIRKIRKQNIIDTIRRQNY